MIDRGNKMSYRYYIGMISNKRLREIKNVANYKELHLLT